MNAEERRFRYLNAEGRWPGFEQRGLERDALGVLRLFALPRLVSPPEPPPASLPAPSGPAGVAVDRDGSLYWSVPGHERLRAWLDCAPAPTCLDGGDAAPLRAPAGLVIPRGRRVLYVADSGGGRVLAFELPSWQWLQEWRDFVTPTALAADEQGRVYVLDAGARRVWRQALSGVRDTAFGQALDASGLVPEPVDVAVDGDAIYVLDAGGRVQAFDPDGRPLEAVATGLTGALGLAAGSGAVYVGDSVRRRVKVFRRRHDGVWEPAGDAVGYEGPVAALALDRRGRLLVHTGTEHRPVALALDAGCAGVGLLWSGPLALDARPHAWQRVSAALERPADAHVQWFVHTGEAPDAPPVLPDTAEPFPAPWRELALDLDSFFVGGAPATHLWLAARFTSDGATSPSLAQLRVDFDRQGYLSQLPEIYREDTTGDFLRRLLALFESGFDELHAEIEGLAVYLDPWAVPAAALPWLAGWLGVELPESLDEPAQRTAVARAFERAARRGTPAGLREALRVFGGVDALLDEPIQRMGWWLLPAEGASTGPTLGFDTCLASAEPQGAVLGSSARLDRSDLIRQDEYAAPLFDDVAHRVAVLVPASALAEEGARERLCALIEREKPAHVAYELCPLEPGLHVGHARLGVESVLGGGPRPPAPLGAGALVLAGEPPGRLGSASVVGVSARL